MSDQTLPAVATSADHQVLAPVADPALDVHVRDHHVHVESKDSFREVVETIVFVVVLVLLLKSFVAEAFVIPTGSMAETLWGYQKDVECPKCRHHFPVNCSSEVDPPERERRTEVVGCVCPNCRYDINFNRDGIDLQWKSGDRVLVSKFVYDTMMRPERFDVVVFKYPVEPQKNHVPMNYIKRLLGLPGETLGIYHGDIYVLKNLDYPGRPRPPHADQLRDREFMYENDPEAVEIFLKQVDSQFEKAVDGLKFEIVRKSPREIMALRRLVFDNDSQPADLKGKVLPRWQARTLADAWATDDAEKPRRFEHKAGAGAEFDWLHYRHILRSGASYPELITDFMGYNTGHPHALPQCNWVGDLMLEFDVALSQAQGELVLELAKGVDRFQARWDLTTGICTLVRRNGAGEEMLGIRPTDLKKKGSYRLRFANIDERLTVWVDGQMPFGDGVTYKPARERGPYENDLQPASVGVRDGALVIEQLKLWRDTYYTTARGVSPNPSNADADGGSEWNYDSEAWRDPSKWDALRNLPIKTLYVQPNHFLCLGDNSPESSDGRSWGLVPRRLLLGRALMVYYPFNRAGPIR